MTTDERALLGRQVSKILGCQNTGDSASPFSSSKLTMPVNSRTSNRIRWNPVKYRKTRPENQNQPVLGSGNFTGHFTGQPVARNFNGTVTGPVDIAADRHV